MASHCSGTVFVVLRLVLAGSLLLPPHFGHRKRFYWVIAERRGGKVRAGEMRCRTEGKKRGTGMMRRSLTLLKICLAWDHVIADRSMAP
eukprot:291410-Hanusia_phi.AAC.2